MKRQVPRTRATAHRRLTAADIALAGIVAATTILAGWVFRSAIVPIDPWDYVEGARNFPNGVWNLAGLSRWGMIVPNLAAAGLWGNAELTYYAWPLATSALLAAMLFLFGSRFANCWAGLAAVALLTSPVVAVHATRGYPDLAATSLVSASLLALIAAADHARDRSHRHASRQGWRIALLLLTAGFLTGWAFETRETTIFTWPALGVALLRVGRPVRSLILFALPAVAWFGADMLASARYFGDALVKLHATSGDLTTSVVPADAKYLGHSRTWYAAKPIQVLFERSGGPLLVALIVIGLIGGAIMWRRLWPTWLWGVAAFLPLWWAGGVGNPTHPSVRLDIARYSLSYAIPLALTGILVIATVIIDRRLSRRAPGIAAAIVLALGAAIPTVRFAGTFPGFATNDGTSLSALREVISEQPDVAHSVVWSDWATQRLAPIYSTTLTGAPMWRARQFRSLNRLIDRPSWEVPAWPGPGDFVIVHSPDDDTCYYCRKAYERVAAAYTLPMPGWQALFRSRSGNLTVYRLGPDASWPR
jgi:hypothetical protein